MDAVWEFVRRYEDNMERDEVAILVAYNGETCDLKWLWKLTHAPRSLYDPPATMAYFMDPLKIIKPYGGCKLNHKHYKLDSLELRVVWKPINSGANLNSAHDSMVDDKAQTDTFSHPSFVPYLNKSQSQSIQPIEETFSKTKVREWKKKLEPERTVHAPWIEVTEEDI